MTAGQGTSDAWTADWARILQRLERSERIDAELAGMRLHFDRPLPFLCVYRAPAASADPGTRQLVQSEAAYLIAEATAEPRRLSSLLRALVGWLSARHGGFLLLEVWSSRAPARDREMGARVLHHRDGAPEAVIEHLVRGLGKVRVGGSDLQVERAVEDLASAPGLPPLLSEGQLRRCGCAMVGVDLQPFYRSPDDSAGAIYPMMLRSLRRPFADALRRALFAFLRGHTSYPVRHYLALGPHALRHPIAHVDRELAAIERSQDFLLEVTPVNAADARSQFEAAHRQTAPRLVYRPCSVDPDLMKRRLYQLPIEDIDDPVMEELFLEKRDELDLKLGMLKNRGTRRFLYGSLQLYGPLEPELLDAARGILARFPRDAARPCGKRLGARAFAERARRHAERIRRELPEVPVGVELRDDVIGVLVSRHTLLVGEGVSIAAGSVEALLAHEVDTHILTHINGSLQRLRLLSVGLVGYEALQEGLAVLAEHLVGGLSVERLRVLAGRVVGAHALIGGASFVDTYRLLEGEHGFAPDTAFGITLRLYRGGGLLKDAVYLRGLLWLLCYLSGRDSELEPLYEGKISAEHLSVVKDLRHRRIVAPPRLLPRYLEDGASLGRLERIRRSEVDVYDLACREAS